MTMRTSLAGGADGSDKAWGDRLTPDFGLIQHRSHGIKNTPVVVATSVLLGGSGQAHRPIRGGRCPVCGPVDKRLLGQISRQREAAIVADSDNLSIRLN